MLCTCDKMGAPWVVKDAMAVIIIILTVSENRAWCTNATLSNGRPWACF